MKPLLQTFAVSVATVLANVASLEAAAAAQIVLFSDLQCVGSRRGGDDVSCGIPIHEKRPQELSPSCL